jgi:hypothetical protein
MKNIIKLTALMTVLTLCSCNRLAKHYGGKMTVEVEKDQKVVNSSWKGDSLWILTRARKTDEQPETFKYVEKSTYGVLEGVVTIIEK